MAEYGARMARGNEVSHEPCPRGQMADDARVASYRSGSGVFTLAVSSSTLGVIGNAVLPCSGPLGYTSALQTFNWVSIDAVSFTSLNTGTVIDNQSTYNHAFGMDNLSITAVPEPESYAPMLAGLVGAVARRRTGK